MKERSLNSIKCTVCGLVNFATRVTCRRCEAMLTDEAAVSSLPSGEGGRGFGRWLLTNFPFAVVTLYPAFFRFPVDDIERATILLHETSHLLGGREEEALQRVWESKQRLGWTEIRYGNSRVWKNTREWTKGAIPAFFSCGPDNDSDCFE